MREILFRGKRADNGEWFYGFYGKSGEKSYIIYDNEIAVAYVSIKDVIPETVGQYTGLTDKNGKKIFEGDIISVGPRKVEAVPAVLYKLTDIRKMSDWFKHHVKYMAVIGNIHDNPELLKGETK